MEVQVNRAFKSYFFFTTKKIIKKQTDFARNYLQPSMQMCRSASILLFQNQRPLLLLPPLLLQIQARSNLEQINGFSYKPFSYFVALKYPLKSNILKGKIHFGSVSRFLWKICRKYRIYPIRMFIYLFCFILCLLVTKLL